MCLAIPAKVIKKEKDWVTVQSQDHTHRANLSLVKNVKVGDYLIISGELALNKISKNINKWWNDKEVIKIKKKFCYNYCNNFNYKKMLIHLKS